MCSGKMAEAYCCFQVFIVFYIPLPHVKFAVHNKQVLTFIISASEEKKKAANGAQTL